MFEFYRLVYQLLTISNFFASAVTRIDLCYVASSEARDWRHFAVKKRTKFKADELKTGFGTFKGLEVSVGQIIDDDWDEPLSFDDAPLEQPVHHPSWFRLSFLNLQDDLEEAIKFNKQYRGPHKQRFNQIQILLNRKGTRCLRRSQESRNT